MASYASDNARGGSARLFGNDGADLLFGNAGFDRLVANKGKEALNGGGGADRFVFGGRDGTNSVTDYQDGLDRIEITSGAVRFRDLEISRNGSDTEILAGRTKITLLDTLPKDIDRADFIFS